jgi:hypothetical protein
MKIFQLESKGSWVQGSEVRGAGSPQTRLSERRVDPVIGAKVVRCSGSR